MPFDSNFIDEIKNKVNIVDVIGRDVNLKKAGSNFKGLCPFHNEKTPSFVVSEQKQIFTCFGCGEKGDVIEYVKKRSGLTFVEAVEQICDDYDIEVPKISGPRIDYDKYYEINRKAARFFYDNMTSSKNPGYSYIRNRGVSDSTIKKFGLGYAPNAWSKLYDHLLAGGVSEEDMLKLGLISRGKDGYYDKFRDRVIFPIFNIQGKVIGFGGRALGDAMPKYLNSSESDIFLKKNNLYALNFTKGDISAADNIIVVEGYMDAISLYQNGVKNIAASLGTALTDNQGKLISRYTKNVTLSYDSDNAGVTAAVRGIDVLKRSGCNVRILRVTDGKDPDDFIRRNGRDPFLNLVKDATPATDFRLEILKRGFDLTDDLEVLDYIRACVPVLRSLGPVEQDIYIKKLASQYGISESAIELEVRTDSKETVNAALTARNASRTDERVNTNAELKTEMSMLVLLTYSIKYLEHLKADKINFRTALCSRIYKAIMDAGEPRSKAGPGLDVDAVCELLDPEEEAVFKSAIDRTRIGPDEDAFYNECKTSYLTISYGERRAELMNELSVAEKLDNRDDVARIADELVELDQTIKNVRRN